jgi:hypothetical protein
MSAANKCACRRTFRLETITAHPTRDRLEHENMSYGSGAEARL